MLILTEITDKIQVVLGGTVTTNQLECMSCWRDITPTTYTPGRTLVLTNNNVDADVVGSPAPSTQRVVDRISVYNNDTVLQNVTVKVDANGTEKVIWKGDLSSGQLLEYENGLGFTISALTPQGYAINVIALTSSPVDAETRYFGTMPKAPVTAAATGKVYIRKAGTIKIAEIYCYSGTAGTAEAWSLYIRINNTTDYLIATLSVSASERVFSNTVLSIPVVVGDYFEIKMINPTWSTNPLTTIFGGYVYIE
jgi:hypothetical protein